MYSFTVTNQYAQPIVVAGATVAPNAPAYTVPQRLGNATVLVPGHGEINFLDIGDRQIGGMSTATWGVLISFEGEEVVCRYEGEGKINLTINSLGQLQLQAGNGVFSKLALPGILLP